LGFFLDAKLGSIMRFPANSCGPEDSVMTASVALNGNPRFAFSPAMSFGVSWQVRASC
jgi:predicted 3-demethylubiquinone-9 3-methyltransferase (glyoxalase superfamily)